MSIFSVAKHRRKDRKTPSYRKEGFPFPSLCGFDVSVFRFDEVTEMGYYKGNVPAAADGWRLVSSRTDGDDVRWLLWIQRQRNADWINWKMVADGKARNKANYWGARSLDGERVAFRRDMKLMKQTRPALATWVDEVLNDD